MKSIERGIYNRSCLLLGEEAMQTIRSKRAIIFGVGGVGSWCAESLLRNGICRMTLVDSDCVCISNCNRQLLATTKTVGQVKVEVLRNRLLEINPEAEIIALQKVYCTESAAGFHLEDYDVIIDAIDSLKDKADLILHATRLAHQNKNVIFMSSMGAALRLDPTKVRMAEFWEIKGDPLARALRNKFKKNQTFPQSKFLCAYSEENPLPNKGLADAQFDTSGNEGPMENDWHASKVQVNGSLSHITGIFGLMLAGTAIQKIISAK